MTSDKIDLSAHKFDLARRDYWLNARSRLSVPVEEDE